MSFGLFYVRKRYLYVHGEFWSPYLMGSAGRGC